MDEEVVNSDNHTDQKQTYSAPQEMELNQLNKKKIEFEQPPAQIEQEEGYSPTKEFCILATKFAGIIVLVGVFGFIFPFILGFSFQIVEPLNWGILVDGNTFEIKTEQLYDSGRYYVGLNGYFLKFPRTNLYIHRMRGSGNIDDNGMYVSDSIKIRTK